jgi:hypothetical protein
MADRKGEAKQREIAHTEDTDKERGHTAEVGRSGGKDVYQDREHKNQSGRNAGDTAGDRGKKRG